jgi:hypothetical protein
MATQVMCPNLRCRKILSAGDEMRGKIVKCQHCQTLLRVPEPKAPAATPATPAKR